MPQRVPREDGPADEASASLADAAARLEAALGRLEALVEAGPLQSELFRRPEGGGGAAGGPTLQAALDQAREREQALEVAAASASQALGRAITEVRRALADPPLDDAGEDDALDPEALAMEDGSR